MRIRTVSIVLGASLITVGAFIVLLMLPSKAHRRLPKTALDIHRQAHSVGEIFKVIMKARISPEEFEKYRARMGFVPLPLQRYTEVFWRREDWQESWWDPTPEIGATYYDPEFGHHYYDTANRLRLTDYTIMKYENGYVYYYHKDL